jgi:hypothetical protein
MARPSKRKVLPEELMSNPRRIKSHKDALIFFQTPENHDIVRKVCGGITRQAVLQWSRIPVEHCSSLERKFGIKREVMRPDIFRD